MMNLIIRGVRNEVNLNSLAKAPYNVKRYEMGTPDGESNGDCIDTITLVIAARTKTLLTTYISRLYRSLREAVDFSAGLEFTPVYLEASVPEQAAPVYAVITDYKFHALGDPYDMTSGGLVVQDATLVIQRRPWSTLPPQLDPFQITIAGKDVTAGYLAKISTRPGIVFPGDNSDVHFGFDYRCNSYTYGAANASVDRAVFLRNCYAYGGITNIHNAVGDVSNKQSRSWPAPGWSMNSTGTAFTFYLGSVGSFASQISAAVFNIETLGVATGGTGLKVYAQMSQNVWQESLPKLDYANGFELERGDALLRWDGNTLPAKTTMFSQQGYWYRVQGQLNDTVATVPYQANRSVYAPYTPYVDLHQTGGDVPSSLRLLLRFHNFNSDSYDTLDDYWLDDQNLPIITVASTRLDSPVSDLPATRGFINMHDNGPETITPINASIQNRLRAPGGKALIVSAADIVDYSATGEMLPIARVSLEPVQPGPYRLYLRYRTEEVGGDGGHMLLRVSVAPMWAGDVSPRSSSSLTHRVQLDRDDLRDRVNVADLGVFSIGTRRLLPSRLLEYEIALMIEGNAASGSVGRIAIHDIIMLPVDETFAVFEGTRTPVASNAEGATVSAGYNPATVYGGMNMHERNSEAVIIDGLLAGTGIAYTARDAFSGDLGVYGTSWPAAVSEPWARRTPNMPTGEPDYTRRIYFFFSKRLPTGELVSTPDFYYSVQAFSDRKFIALPAKL